METPSPPRAVILGSDPEVARVLRDAGGGDAFGVRILGSLILDEFPEYVEAHGVSHVLLAAGVDGSRLRAVLDACGRLRLRFKAIVPAESESDAPGLRDVEPDDLVRREHSVTIDARIRGEIAGRRALVTGAAGTIGAAACDLLLKAGAESLIMIDRDERRLERLRERLIRQVPGAVALTEPADIRDARQVRSLMDRHRPQDVVHAAAEKDLPELETAPCEAAGTNVLGTQYLVEAADACGADRFVYVSTDKAVRPSSVMGASKRIAEKFVRAANRRSRTRFVAVRFGNVMGSSRSVVPLFRKQIASGGPIGVTHPDVSRYFMTRAEAVALVVRAAYRENGELYVLDMGEPIRILDLARYLVSLAGLAPEMDVAVELVGLRPGEKLHEELLGPGESACSDRSGLISVSGPRPPVELETLPTGLTAAVRSGDDARALEWLRRLAPGYAPGKEARRAAFRPGPSRLVDDSPARP